MTVIMPQDGSISEALASQDWVLQAQISGDVGQGAFQRMQMSLVVSEVGSSR